MFTEDDVLGQPKLNSASLFSRENRHRQRLQIDTAETCGLKRVFDLLKPNTLHTLSSPTIDRPQIQPRGRLATTEASTLPRNETCVNEVQLKPGPAAAVDAAQRPQRPEGLPKLSPPESSDLALPSGQASDASVLLMETGSIAPSLIDSEDSNDGDRPTRKKVKVKRSAPSDVNHTTSTTIASTIGGFIVGTFVGVAGTSSALLAASPADVREDAVRGTAELFGRRES